MTDLQEMIVENSFEKEEKARFEWRQVLSHLATGCMIYQQIVILSLFIYIFIELMAVKTQIQPSLNFLQRINMTQINETLNDVTYLAQFAKKDVLPEYYKLKPTLNSIPAFINSTEAFITQIESIVRSYLPHMMQLSSPNCTFV